MWVDWGITERQRNKAEQHAPVMGAWVGVLLAILDRGRQVRLDQRHRGRGGDEQGPGKPSHATVSFIASAGARLNAVTALRPTGKTHAARGARVLGAASR
jgi:hypothetical protein